MSRHRALARTIAEVEVALARPISTAFQMFFGLFVTPRAFDKNVISLSHEKQRPLVVSVDCLESLRQRFESQLPIFFYI